MRLFLILLVVLAVAGIYLYLNPDAATVLKTYLPEPEFSKKTDRIYKWRNAQGEWQLTDKPPADGVEYKRTDYHEDLNVLPVPPAINSK